MCASIVAATRKSTADFLPVPPWPELSNFRQVLECGSPLPLWDCAKRGGNLQINLQFAAFRDSENGKIGKPFAAGLENP
jgi:hypothetical protein